MIQRILLKRWMILIATVAIATLALCLLNGQWATAEPAKPAMPRSPGETAAEEPADEATADLGPVAPTELPIPRIAASNPATRTTRTGQTLSIVIDTPPDGESVLVPPGQVLVAGRTAIGDLVASANILYVMDVSASTVLPESQDCDGDGNPGGPGDDLNGDGSRGDVLDCEISGLLALNASLFGISGVDTGIVPFGDSAASADVGPASGQQDFTTPFDADKNANTVPDLEEVVRSLDQGEVHLFTYEFLDSGGTNFDDALTSVNAAFATQPPGERNIVFFLSDGDPSAFSAGPGSPLDTAAVAGTVINTYSIGSDATGCGSGAALRIIADAASGTCTEVLDPSDLRTTLEGTVPAGIDRVELCLNSGPPINTTLDALGNWSALPTPLLGIILGPNTISATVYATDATSTTAATAVTAGVTVLGVESNDGPEPAPAPPQGGGSGPPIPEPTTITLVGLGLAGLAGYAWRRRQANRSPPTA